MSKASDYISSGDGSGGGYPINAVVAINSDDTHYTAPNGTEWLQTGTTATDTNGDYTDATVINGVIGIPTAGTEDGTPTYTRIK